MEVKGLDLNVITKMEYQKTFKKENRPKKDRKIREEGSSARRVERLC